MVIDTVPTGARTAYALIEAKGSWGTNAACYWYMRHNQTGIVASSRVHNQGVTTTPADQSLFAVIPVNEGDSFQCYVVCNNDPGSGSNLYLRQSYYTYTFTT